MRIKRVSLVVIALLLTACDAVGNAARGFVENSPSYQTLSVREVTAQQGQPVEGYPTATPRPTRTPGPTITPYPPSTDAVTEYYRGIYDVCVATIANDPAVIQANRLQSIEELWTYCNGFVDSISGWQDGPSPGYEP